MKRPPELCCNGDDDTIGNGCSDGGVGADEMNPFGLQESLAALATFEFGDARRVVAIRLNLEHDFARKNQRVAGQALEAPDFVIE